jgi:hypothetical protein
VTVVRCDLCQTEDSGVARGWIAVRTDIPDEGDDRELAFFCPECAEREFELRSARLPTRRS